MFTVTANSVFYREDDGLHTLIGETTPDGQMIPPPRTVQDEMYLRGNQLAAISTVLMSDTPISLAAVRIPKDHALYTAAFQDAIRTIEKVISLRRENVQHRGIANVLADRLAGYTGTTVPDVIREARSVCAQESSESDLLASGGIVDAP